MAQKDTAVLKAQADATINTNGANAITGALHNAMLNDIIDSMVNKDSDSLSIVTNVYRSALQAVTAATVQITFSTPLANALYEVIIFDPFGVGFETIADKQPEGFKIDGLSSGNIIYLVILTN